MEIDLELLQHNDKLLDESKFGRSLIESISPDGLMIVNKSKKIIFCNNSISEILGYTKKQLLGMGVSKFFKNKENFKKCEEKMSKNLEMGGYCLTTEEFITKKKKEIYVEISAAVVIGSSDMVVVVREVTERIKSRRKLEETLFNYRILVENCKEGIVVIQDQTIKFVNKAILDYTGYDEKDMLEKDFTAAVSPDEREKLIKNNLRRIGGEEFEHTYKTKLISKKGKKIDVEINSNLIDYNGKPAVLVLVRPLDVFCPYPKK